MAVTGALYDVLTVPAGNEVVVICSGAMLIVRLRVPDWALLGVGVCESVTPTVKVYVPPTLPLGVPESRPVLPMDSPGGRLPLAGVQLM